MIAQLENIILFHRLRSVHVYSPHVGISSRSHVSCASIYSTHITQRNHSRYSQCSNGIIVLFYSLRSVYI